VSQHDHSGPDPVPPRARAGKVLVVDDDLLLRRAIARVLEGAGFSVTQAKDGTEALAAVRAGEHHAMISDISMPGMSGMQLLRAVRENDLDLPVVLMTGDPSVDTAAQAVEYGALRYLTKPLDMQTLLAVVSRAVKLQSIAVLKREAATYLGSADKLLGDRAGLEASFARALDTLHMAYQPLVDWPNQRVAAFEALVRTREPTLPSPLALLSAAERLGRVYDVGRAIRQSIARTLRERSVTVDIFVNLHPSDVFDDTLIAPDAPLAPFAHRVVLEITERAALEDRGELRGRMRCLREMGFRVAIDDLGAGYAGLGYFALLAPEVVKLDMGLVRDVHREAIKRKLVGSLTAMCKDLSIVVVAEGVETADERDTVAELGCDLLQGYLFAKPGPPFPEVVW
jgi:EAL domain-containing protein (putative c-di-GMP-specific phosphodiesterase class I)